MSLESNLMPPLIISPAKKRSLGFMKGPEHTWRPPPVALRNGNPPGLGKGTPQRSRHPCGIPHCPIAMPLVASQAPRWKKRRAAPRARPPLPQREHGGTNTPNRPARLSRPALGWWPNDLDARESLLAFFEVIGTGEKCSAPPPPLAGGDCHPAAAPHNSSQTLGGGSD